MKNSNNTNDKDHIFPDKGKSDEFFKAPEGYFESLQDRVMDRVHNMEQEGGRIIQLRKRRILFSAAAILIIMLGISSILLQFKKNNSEINGYELATADIVDYLLLNDFSEPYVIEFISNIDSITEEGFETIPDTSISSDDILEYLLENDLSETELYNL